MGTLQKILMVDDDADLREALADQLVPTEEFDVFEAGNGDEGLTRAKEQHYDLVILDVGLPDMDGRELCRLLRKQGVKCPIIMLTGITSDADQIQGLDAGANDYVAKPFKLPVLLARIRAQLRQHEQSEDAVFGVGPYSFRPAAKMLLDEQEKKIRLTEKETNILKYLYRAGERGGAARRPAARGLGLQRRRHHPHAGDPHLPAAPEDRARPGQRPHPRHRARRLPPRLLTQERPARGTSRQPAVSRVTALTEREPPSHDAHKDDPCRSPRPRPFPRLRSPQGGPPVEQGPPNAPDYAPAFPGQTRAPEAKSGVELAVETVADGLAHPWGMALLPDGAVLVTERPGRLRVVTADGTVSEPVRGLPEVYAEGQGGLLDVALGRDLRDRPDDLLDLRQAHGRRSRRRRPAAQGPAERGSLRADRCR